MFATVKGMIMENKTAAFTRLLKIMDELRVQCHGIKSKLWILYAI